MSADSICEDHILKILERIVPLCKDRHSYLKAACQFVPSRLSGDGAADLSSQERANLLFYPLKLAVESKDEQFVCSALDGIQNLLQLNIIAKDTKYAPPNVPEPPRKKSFFNIGSSDAILPSPTPRPDSEDAELLINTIIFCVCTNAQTQADDVHNQIVRTLLAAVSSASACVHGKLLLFIIRANYDIFRATRSTPVQTSSRAALSQIVGIVLNRMESAEAANFVSGGGGGGSSSNVTDPAAAASAGDDGASDGAGSSSVPSMDERADEAGEAGLSFSNQEEQDCFLVLRRFCKVSMSAGGSGGAAAGGTGAGGSGSGTVSDVNEVRSKQLSLSLIHNFVSSSGPKLRASPTFVLALRKYVCGSLMQNCVLTNVEVAKVAYDMLHFVMVEFRQHLKQQVKIIFQNILFPIIDSQNATFAQKDLVLATLNRFAGHPQAVLDLFVNFDCVVGNPGIFEQLVNAISKAVRSNHAVPNWVTTKQSEMLKIRAINTIRSLLKSLVTFVQEHQPPASELSEGVLLREGGLAAAGEDAVGNASPSSPSSPGLATASTPPEESEIEKMRKSKKTYEAVIETFNTKKPMDGIDFAVELGILSSKTASDVAKFLLTPGLDKVKIGEFLAANKPFPKEVLREFIDLHDFTGYEIDEAMRLFLGKFKIQGEAETVDRTMERFAERYCEQNPSVFSSAGTAYVLAFSIMMLNTDAHSPHVQKKMSQEEFIRNNRGIDDGKDLSPRFLTEIFTRIKSREIKLEGDDGLKQGRPAAAAAAAASEVSNQMSDMDKLFLSLEKKRQLQFKAESSTLQQQSLQQLQSLCKAQGGSPDVHHEADTADIVQPMWEAIWTAVLPALSVPMEETDEPCVIDACLEGIDEAMKLSCLFATTTEREAFMSTLATFTHLTSYREIHYKSVRAIQTILAIADRDGDSLEGSWYEVLKCISLLDRLQLLVSDRSAGPPVLTAQAYDQKRTERFNADMISQYIDLVTIDRIITKSKLLGGRAVVHLVEQLCRISVEELQENPRPRTYSLQKLVEVAELNIGRLRYVWSQMWTYLSAHFVTVGLDNQELVAMYVVDSLRQLAMKFLERNELGNFNFQRDFLKPFEIIVAQSKRNRIRELVVASLRQMVEARAVNIMSGWKIVINTIARCAACHEVAVVSSAFDLLKLITERYIHFIFTPELFAETIIAWSHYGENKISTDIAFTAIEYLKLCAAFIVYGIPEGGLAATNVGETAVERLSRSLEVKGAHRFEGAVTAFGVPTNRRHPCDGDMNLWLCILASLSANTNGQTYETRMCAIDGFFALVGEYGSHFSDATWSTIVGRTLFPIFEKLFGDILECHNLAEPNNEVYSNLLRLLDRTLNGSLALLNDFFDQLCPVMGDIANIMLSCGRKNDRKVSQLGFNAFAAFITAPPRVHRALTDEEWEMMSKRVCCASRSWLVIADGVLKSDAEGLSNIRAAEANARVLSHLLRTLRSCMLSPVVPTHFFAPFQPLFADCYRLSTSFFSDPLCRDHVEEFPSLQPVLLALEKEASDCFIEIATRLKDDNQLMEWVRQVLSRFVALSSSDTPVALAERGVLLDILINVIGATLQLSEERFKYLVSIIYDDLCSLIRCCDRSLSAVLCSVFLRLSPNNMSSRPATGSQGDAVAPAARKGGDEEQVAVDSSSAGFAGETHFSPIAVDTVTKGDDSDADPTDSTPQKGRRRKKKN